MICQKEFQRVCNIDLLPLKHSSCQTCSSRYPNQGSNYVLLPSRFRSDRS